MVNGITLHVQEVEDEVIWDWEFEEMHQRFEDVTKVLDKSNACEGLVFRVTSPSFAQHLVVNLNKICICTGLDCKTMERFWIFVMTETDAFEGFIDYEQENLQDLFD